MSAIGLLYVGAVLLLNGLVLLGVITLRSAAPMNLFVGTLQCVVPTILMVQAGADGALLLQAAGLYLFGFTYLFVGIAGFAGLDVVGIGWFSLFVAVTALTYAVVSAYRLDDVFSAVLWLSWALLWGLFFLLFALDRTTIEVFTGWSTILLGQATCTFPAIALLLGFQPTRMWALALAVTVAALVGLAALLSRHTTSDDLATRGALVDAT
ncbi:AmiS/UreI family transporter [Mycolicibacterium smegmatis]|uniref:AmiS/UreI family transporter n=1 Tax=Mycolicibacterium smegmatis TaxID=1772 RepID=UPI001302FAAB|nr:AmiS/UreI family transporter [Mycolicibacterium smegmatis]